MLATFSVGVRLGPALARGERRGLFCCVTAIFSARFNKVWVRKVLRLVEKRVLGQVLGSLDKDALKRLAACLSCQNWFEIINRLIRGSALLLGKVVLMT